MIQSLLLLPILVPFFGLFLFILTGRNEKKISVAVRTTLLFHFLATLALIAQSVISGGASQLFNYGSIFTHGDFHFDFELLSDKASLVFLFLTTFLTNLVASYSQYYLHRETGYLRFFTTLLFFNLGMSLLSLAGSINIFFAGWEIVGISSFVLIAFYSNREQPSRNALKVFSIYRICDLGLIGGVILSHAMDIPAFNQNFLYMINPEHVIDPALLALFSGLIIFAAIGKSAQFPFMNWLSRAMEGPTPSSAIFYGALSVHAGAFLLMRTHDLWSQQMTFKILVAGIGLTTAVLSTTIGRIQSNIKGQLAYASASQVGIIFVEISLGFHVLALIHIFTHACLRCYQILISPSIVAQQLRLISSISGGQERHWSPEEQLPSRLRSSIYVLALNEGYLELGRRLFYQRPLLKIVHFFRGDLLNSKTFQRISIAAATIASCILLIHFFKTADLSHSIVFYCQMLVMCCSLYLSLCALSIQGRVSSAWYLIGGSLLLLCMGTLMTLGQIHTTLIYWAGTIPFWILGIFLLKHYRGLKLNRWNGFSRRHIYSSRIWFVLVLAIAGLPISSSFIGEDILLEHLGQVNLTLAVLASLQIMINGLAAVRIFARSCWGPTAIALLITCGALHVQAQCDGAKGFSGFIRPSYSVATAAVSSYGAPATSGTTLSWTRENQVAATEAAPQGILPFDKVARSQWNVSQSRMRYCAEVTDGWAATTEIDFVDFDRAQATTSIRPRMRVLEAQKTFSESWKFSVGQNWDIMSVYKPHTYNFVGLYFRSGNIGFMRPQVRITHLKDSLEQWSVALGSTGINDSGTMDSSVERTVMPSIGARYFLIHESQLRLSIAGRALNRRFEDTRGNEMPRWSTAASTSAEWKPTATTEIHFNLYTGTNIESAGSSLTLSTGSYTGEQSEIGGYLTGNWKFAEKWSTTAGFGFANLLESSEGREGDLANNRIERAALGWKESEKAEFFLELTNFDSHYRWRNPSGIDSNSQQIETGLILKM